MASNQYDVSPKLFRLFQEKQKIREAIRQAVIKRRTNPHLRVGAEYDSAIIRYHALWAYRSDHVYSNTRNVTVLFVSCFLPAAILFLDALRYSREKEAKFRSGKVAYEDRCFKYVV